MDARAAAAAIPGITLELCPAYNGSKGCDEDKGACGRLHLCKSYVRKKPHSKWQCRRSHGLYDERNLRLLRKHGVDVSLDSGQVMRENRRILNEKTKLRVSHSCDDLTPFQLGHISPLGLQFSTLTPKHDDAKSTSPPPKVSGIQASTAEDLQSTSQPPKVSVSYGVQDPASNSKRNDSKSAPQALKVLTPTAGQTLTSANIAGDSKLKPQPSNVLTPTGARVSTSAPYKGNSNSTSPLPKVSTSTGMKVSTSEPYRSTSNSTSPLPKVLVSTGMKASTSASMADDSKLTPQPSKILTPTTAQVSAPAPNRSTSNSTSPVPKVLASTGIKASTSAPYGNTSNSTSPPQKIPTPTVIQVSTSGYMACDSKPTPQPPKVLTPTTAQVSAPAPNRSTSNSTSPPPKVSTSTGIQVSTAGNMACDSKPTTQPPKVSTPTTAQVSAPATNRSTSNSTSPPQKVSTSTGIQVSASANMASESTSRESNVLLSTAGKSGHSNVLLLLVASKGDDSQEPKTPTSSPVNVTSSNKLITANALKVDDGDKSQTSQNRAVAGFEHHVQSTESGDESSSSGKAVENNSSSLLAWLYWLNPLRLWAPAATKEIALEIQPEICVDYLEGLCRNSTSCQHNRHKYQWQKNDKKTRRWLDLTVEENKKVEEMYCDPAVEFFDVKNLSLRIDFTKMPFGRVDRSCDFRRLSTPSSCDTHCKSDHATEWIWYWLDENKWISYDSVSESQEEGSQTSPSSRDIEVQYLKTPGGSLTFKLQGQKYRIDFKKAVQKNLSSTQGTERKVQRRPKGKCYKMEAQPEVCTDHLEGICRNGNTCPRHHSRSPYQWQQYDKGTQRWHDSTMEENNRLEESFSNPEADTFAVSNSLNIDFTKMLQGRIDVASGIRRLSTLSSCEKLNKSDHATEWIWYWLDENNQWISYDSGLVSSGLGGGSQTSPSSRDIEVQYLKTPGGSLTFKLQGQQYRIDFKKAVQKNLSSAQETERKVQRRPKGKCSKTEAQPEVCTDHLEGVCRNGNTCPRHHSRSPYQWQQYDQEKQRWHDFTLEENNTIEESFSNPEAENFDVSKSLRIDFTKMLQGRIDRTSGIRRLSSNERSNGNYATEWVWYWLDPHNQWVSYGSVFSGGSQASVSSKDIERQYRKTPDGWLLFKTREFNYKIDFKTFTQKNLDPNYGTERKLKRRPKRKSSDDLVPKGTPAPSHWDPRKIPETGYQLVDIPNDSTEYKKIEVTFGQTMKEYKIKKIQRVQNLELWDGFQRQKIWMQKKLVEGQTVDIRELFHGTKDEHIDAICRQGFDPRVSGTSSGTAYGQGSYFARNANYSRKYSSGNKMFMARVLVGEYSTGDPNYKRPPPKSSSSKDLYDSCVNHVNSPTIFVVFKQEQAYPEWLIEYTSSSWWSWGK